MNQLNHKFPKEFTWGVATSSFQIEGATQLDGRGASIWDTFCNRPGAIADGSNGDIACDHYHKYSEDVQLMHSLNIQAYRFSIAWPRIYPQGTGTVNQKGIDFYDRLVDELLKANITPWITLYHWDLPQALEDLGGWTHRNTCYAFADYASTMAHHLGDRVQHWITHNEPWCASVLGYLNGEHAPGIQSNQAHLESSHHLLLSHGLAVSRIREESKAPQTKVGITLNLVPAEPASHSTFDQQATQRFDAWFNRWYLEPLYNGIYPNDLMQAYQSEGYVDDWGFLQDGDLDIIATPTDFLGINYYSRGIIRSDKVTEEENDPIIVKANDHNTDMGWEVYPNGLRELLHRVHKDYAPKAIYVTENGAAYDTAPNQFHQVPDVLRQGYLQEHIHMCYKAIHEGVPLKGYFAWSLLDNFEWAFGYEKRFGLVWIDYETQVRIPKNSALWYRDLIERGGY